MTALSILERPPCADVFFDNHGTLDTEEDIFLAKYKTKEVSLFDLIDGGERLGNPMPPPRFDIAIVLPKWQEKSQRIPKPNILPKGPEVGFD